MPDPADRAGKHLTEQIVASMPGRFDTDDEREIAEALSRGLREAVMYLNSTKNAECYCVGDGGPICAVCASSRALRSLTGDTTDGR